MITKRAQEISEREERERERGKHEQRFSESIKKTPTNVGAEEIQTTDETLIDEQWSSAL